MTAGEVDKEKARSLFRLEVLQARSAQALGSIRIDRQPGFTAVALISLGMAAMLIAYGVWGQATRKARVAGVLVPSTGSIALAAPQPAVLLEQRVQEGQMVAAQQVLFVLGTDRTTAQGNTAVLVAQSLVQRRSTLEAERSLRLLQARQRVQSLGDRLRGLDAEQQRAEQETELAQRRVELATRSAERFAQLSAGGFVSDVQVQQKQEELIDLQGRAQAAQRTTLALARERQSVQAELDGTATQRDTDVAQLDRTLAALAQEAAENRARQQVVVVAPQAGRVTGLTQGVGAALQAGQTLATLLPAPGPELSPRKGGAVGRGPFGSDSGVMDAPLQAHLYAPSRTAGFVRTGQTVWLRYAAYPYQKFGLAQGEVIEVSQSPIAPQDFPPGQQQALSQAAQSIEPLYRITVGLADQTILAYGRSHLLKPGMALDADLLQDRRAVWEWVLEPLLAVSARAIP
jgi:membrane fusion protein